jgi:hypothetical protein
VCLDTEFPSRNKPDPPSLADPFLKLHHKIDWLCVASPETTPHHTTLCGGSRGTKNRLNTYIVEVDYNTYYVGVIIFGESLTMEINFTVILLIKPMRASCSP